MDLKRLVPIFALLVFMAVGHFAIALPFGLYEQEFIWIDKLFHVLAGMLYSMIGWLLFQRKLGSINNFTKVFFTIQFALLGSFIWELFEFTYATWFNDYALRFKFYSPGVQDALLGMLFGILGGAIISIMRYVKDDP